MLVFLQTTGSCTPGRCRVPTCIDMQAAQSGCTAGVLTTHLTSFIDVVSLDRPTTSRILPIEPTSSVVLTLLSSFTNGSTTMVPTVVWPTVVSSLVVALSFFLRAAWSAAIFGGEMFFGSLPAGLISRFSRDGQLAVSIDRDLFQEANVGTLRVAAVKRGGSLELWVNGKLITSATDDSLASVTRDQLGWRDIREGQGAIGKLKPDAVTNVETHDRALSAAELQPRGSKM